MAPIILAPGVWWGWHEVPARDPGWGASPILVTEVQPLKTGRSALRVGFIHALRPVAAVRRSVVMRVGYRGADHLAGTIRDDDGTIRSVIVAAADFDWLSSFCPAFWRCRPPVQPTLIINGNPSAGPGPQKHLAQALGHDEHSVLVGAHAGHLGGQVHPMPDRTATFALDLTFDPFDSWLIARGFRPQEMEEKWFIHAEGDRLLFRRSWTGLLIYDVALAWQGERLHLGEVRVNRETAQYKGTDDAHDRRILEWLIVAILLGRRATFPYKPGLSPGDSAIEAWSVAGKASL
jgi:hypothetical protein